MHCRREQIIRRALSCRIGIRDENFGFIMWKEFWLGRIQLAWMRPSHSWEVCLPAGPGSGSALNSPGPAGRALLGYGQWEDHLNTVYLNTSRACVKSEIRSSGSSRPTETRNMPGVMPIWRRMSSGTCGCEEVTGC